MGAFRFVNRDPVWRVDDRQPIAQPEEHEYLRITANVHDVVRRPVLETLAFPPHPRAMNISSLGEVPDSTWYQNRISVRDLTPAEVAVGPNGSGGPDMSEPLTILSTKEGGVQIGFIMEDARGDRYILKFDTEGAPELETGADVVVQRLLWALGYNVPEDTVIHFRRDQIRVAPDATRSLSDDEEEPLTEADLDEVLQGLPRAADGERWRGLVSKLLGGVPVGGFSMTGTRPDDVNDLVPHEHRRDVRAQKVFFAWMGHTDIKEDNTLDMWIEDPPGSGHGYLVHHLLDFGKALGGKGFEGRAPQDAFAYQFDYGWAGASLVTFGLWRRPWEEIPHSELRGVGRFESERFRPDLFRTTRPYTPFSFTDRFDAYWASKVMMRLTPELIAAAVEQGQYSDPRTRAYLTRTLVERQRKTARHWFAQVSPVDGFRVEPEGDAAYRICAEDLLLVHDLAGDEVQSRYELAAYDYEGRALGWGTEVPAREDGLVCAAGLHPAGDHDGYTMVAVRAYRGDTALPWVVAHLAQNPETGRFRVIGIYRR